MRIVFKLTNINNNLDVYFLEERTINHSLGGLITSQYNAYIGIFNYAVKRFTGKVRCAQGLRRKRNTTICRDGIPTISKSTSYLYTLNLRPSAHLWQYA